MKKVITLDYIMAGCKTFFNRLTSYVSKPVILQTRNNIPFYQPIANIKNSQLNKHGIPNPPKRPKTSFFVFKENILPEIKKDNPELKMKEIVRIVSEKWANYPIEKKEEMKQNALEDFKRYRENYQNYKTSLTDEQLKKLEEAKDKIKLKKTNLKLKNKKKELDKPKRPSSAYNSFCRDRYFKLDESVPFKERMILLAQQWKNEDAEVKKKYRDDYLEKMTVYNEILKEWEQKMVELGHFDMIGSNKLRKLHKQFQKKAKL